MWYQVVVPCKLKKVKGRWIDRVIYPATGCQLYTREKAIEVLKQFYNRNPWKEGDERECWAEGDNDRFTLHFPDLLI